jgi:CRISPR-associated protein Csm2
MSSRQSQDVTVFSFHLGELKEIRDRRGREREEKFLRKKFEEWSIDPSRTMVLGYGDLKRIITTTPDDEESQASAEMLVKWAQRIGAVLKSLGLSKSQIRNIFGTVRQIDMSWPKKTVEDREVKDEEKAQARFAARQVLLLKPKLAYQAKRTATVSKLADVLDPALDIVGTSREHFENFLAFFEAILAYHTAFGGK